VAQGEYDLAAGAQFADDPDVLRRYYVQAERVVAAAIRVNDPQLEQWLDQAAGEDDTAKRAELYRLAQHRIIEKVYGIPVYVLLYNLATSSAVTGVEIDTHGFPQFHGARLVAS